MGTVRRVSASFDNEFSRREVMTMESNPTPYWSHSAETMRLEFLRYRNNARLQLAYGGSREKYEEEIRFAAAFLEAAMTFPF